MMENVKEIKELANYCLNCKNAPCKKACPLGNNIPEFINCIKQNDFEKASYVLADTTYLSSLCGRICPHSRQCEGSCVRRIKGKPVSIGRLEAFVGDLGASSNIPFKKANEKNSLKVAVIGSGPAGLSCSAKLASLGYNVTIFEKEKNLGGLLYYGIPSFRLEKSIVEDTISRLIDLGITVKTNTKLGRDFTLTTLLKNYDAIFLGFGAPHSSLMNIPRRRFYKCFRCKPSFKKEI